MNHTIFPRLEISLFHGFRVLVHGEPFPRLHSQKSSLVLALLVLKRGKPVSREWLIEQIWPDSPCEKGQSSLSACLSDLRKALGAEQERLTRPEAGQIAFAPLEKETLLSVDVWEFDDCIQNKDWVQAIQVYQGPLLKNTYLEAVEWERIRRQEQFVQALEHAAQQRLQEKHFAKAEDFARRALAEDPLRDSLCRLLLQILAAEHNFAKATEEYRRFRAYLKKNRLEPEPETRELYKRLRQKMQDATVSREEAKCAPAASRLPVPLTSLIGREEELQTVCGLVRTNRLVTVTGPGGVGKTRLVQEVATTLGSFFEHGVHFIDFSSLRDPALVTQAVAEKLEVAKDPERSLLQTLHQHLRFQETLLIFDNCEHLLEAIAFLVSSLLTACSHLQVLTTSRVSLNITAEQLYALSPLALPPPQHPVTRESIQAFPAIVFFMHRLREHEPTVTLTEENAPFVLPICRSLDGLPLALELAAARIRTLSLEEIAQGISDRRLLLTRGRRDVRLEHTTMWGALDWSYALLPEAERRLFGTFSVFVGGCTLEALRQVWEQDAQEAPLVETLSALIDSSLVLKEEAENQTRYRMLETVREYGSEKLMASGGRSEVRKRHAAYFRQCAETMQSRWTGPEQKIWALWYTTEQANLRTALDWLSAEEGNVLEALRFATALGAVWSVCGHYLEGRDHLSHLLKQSEGIASSLETAQALTELSTLERRLGDYQAALSHNQEAVALYEGAQDTRGLLNARMNTANICMEKGDYGEAEHSFSQCLPGYEALEDRVGIAHCLNNLAAVAFARGDLLQAHEVYQNALQRHQAEGFTQGIADTLNNLGNVAWMQGHLETAETRYREVLALYRTLRHEQGIAVVLVNLGAVCTTRENYTQALTYYEEALAMVRASKEQRTLVVLLNNIGEAYCFLQKPEAARPCFLEGMTLSHAMGNKPVLIECLDGLAWVYTQTKCWEQAACLLAAVEKFRGEYSCPLSEGDQNKRQKRVERVQAALEADTFEQQSRTGHHMPLEQVVQFCQTEV